MNIDEIEYLRKNQKRTPLIVANQFAKAYENLMLETSEASILKDKTARTILIYLSYRNGVTQRELVKATQMKGSTVSIALSKLEENGLIIKEENEFDMRSVRILITEKGREVETKIEVLLKDIEKKIMKGISEKDAKIAVCVLEQMLENLFS